MAPISTAGFAAKAAPAGYRSGPQRITVPRLVPTEVETMQQIRKAAAT